MVHFETNRVVDNHWRQVPLLLKWTILIPAWISYHMRIRVRGEITYPFPNFNGCTAEVWEWISKFHLILYNGCNYLSVMGFKLNHISKMGPWSFSWDQQNQQWNKNAVIHCRWSVRGTDPGRVVTPAMIGVFSIENWSWGFIPATQNHKNFVIPVPL